MTWAICECGSDFVWSDWAPNPNEARYGKGAVCRRGQCRCGRRSMQSCLPDLIPEAHRQWDEHELLSVERHYVGSDGGGLNHGQ